MYLESPPPPCLASRRPVVPKYISTSISFKNMGSIGSKGGASGSQMSCPGEPAGITLAQILAPPAISTCLHSYCSLHSDPGSLSVSCPPPSSAFVGFGIPPPLAAFSGFVEAGLPASPPLPSVRWPDPKEEVVAISPCSHCSSLLPSLVSVVEQAKSRSAGHSTGHHSVAGHHGGRSSSSPSGGHGGPASSSPSAFCHGGSIALTSYDSDWTTSSVEDLSRPIPLSVNCFTLPPMKSGDNYLKIQDLILF
jgi:hypothetical protein